MDEPKMISGTLVLKPGIAVTPGSGEVLDSHACSSWTSCGKFSAARGSRRRARPRVCWSVPGARPRPRSMRPG